MGLVRLGISTPAATTATTLFTSDNQYLVSVIATNKSTSTAATIRVWIQPSGTTQDYDAAYMVYELPIDAANSYETFRFAVNQGDTVKVYASTANISFSAYGVVQYDVKLGAGISSFQTTAPANPVNGMIWVDSDAVIAGGGTAKPIYIYDASTQQWVSAAAPTYDNTTLTALQARVDSVEAIAMLGL